MKVGLNRQNHVLISHLQAAWNQAIRQGRDPVLTVEREDRIFELVSLADPCPGKYLSWLAAWRRRQWDIIGVGTACSLEELDGLTQALAAYHRSRKKLLVEHRDVGRLRTVEDLMTAVAAQQGGTAQQLSKTMRTDALAGSVLIFRERPWELFRLESEAAARWWGMGTRWCTAARDGNQFARYAAAGELLVLTTPTGRYQFHPATGEFKDARDDPADLRAVLRDAPRGLSVLLLN